jgi:hypothetical protein
VLPFRVGSGGFVNISKWVAARLLISATVLLTLATTATAQIPEKFTNLKVLSPEISRPELVEIMKGFTQGLGVRCTACHMGEEGKPLKSYDFASDEKRMKQNARVMLQMVQEINSKNIPKLHLDAPPIKVSCYTCHRGQKQPAITAPAPVPAPASAPAPGATPAPKPTS